MAEDGPAWTWETTGQGYLKRCDECGFDPAELRPEDSVVAVRSFVRRYQAPLTRGLPGEDVDAVVRRASDPGVWSALGYALHMRDVFRVTDERIRSALARDEPAEPVVDWEQMVAAAAPTASRAAVVEDLADTADTLAVTLAELTPDEWELPTLTGRGHPATVRDLAIMVVHEGSHHLLDIGRVLRSARGR